MKRFALALVFAVMLGLCGCGKAEVPVNTTESETTTEPILEPVILSVKQEWFEWDPPGNYKMPILHMQALDVGGSFDCTLCDGCFGARVTIEAFDNETVSVTFITSGDGWIDHTNNTGSAYNKWNEVIPYDEAYVITSPSNRVTYTYTFTKNF